MVNPSIFNLSLTLSIGLLPFVSISPSTIASSLTLKCFVVCVHHLIFTSVPTEMGLKGPAKPVVIIIITFIIIFFTISRVSYYPPPCFPVAKSKVLWCQPYKLGTMPKRHLKAREAFVIWRLTSSLHLFRRQGLLGSSNHDLLFE